jgi:hypothetical protein
MFRIAILERKLPQTKHSALRHSTLVCATTKLAAKGAKKILSRQARTYTRDLMSVCIAPSPTIARSDVSVAAVPSAAQAADASKGNRLA